MTSRALRWLLCLLASLSVAPAAPLSRSPGVRVHELIRPFKEDRVSSVSSGLVRSWLRNAEGAYHVPDPARDPGGPTAWGISSRSYPDLDLRILTLDEATEIAIRDYWRPIRADELHPGVGLALFDFAFHSGTATAVRALQSLVGVGVDGVMGPLTVAATNRVAADYLISALMARRSLYLQSLPNAKGNLLGWERRLFSLTLTIGRAGLLAPLTPEPR